MATWDNQRYRKTYSYYRAVPKPETVEDDMGFPFLTIFAGSAYSANTSPTVISETYIDPAVTDLSKYTKMVFEVIALGANDAATYTFELYDTTNSQIVATLTTSATTSTYLYSAELDLPAAGTIYAARGYTSDDNFYYRMRMARLRFVK